MSHLIVWHSFKSIKFPLLAIVIIQITLFTFWPVEARFSKIFSMGAILFPSTLPFSSVLPPRLLLSSSSATPLRSMSRVLRVDATDPRISHTGRWSRVTDYSTGEWSTDNHTLTCEDKDCEFLLLFRGSFASCLMDPCSPSLFLRQTWLSPLRYWTQDVRQD